MSEAFQTTTLPLMETLSVNKVVVDGQSGSDGYLTDPGSIRGSERQLVLKSYASKQQHMVCRLSEYCWLPFPADRRIFY